MHSKSPVELADRISRKRALVVGATALLFLVVQAVARPVFAVGPETMSLPRMYVWAIHAGLLLVILATGGALLTRPAVRRLVNDEIAHAHRRTGIAIGYWLAMAIAMALFVLPSGATLTLREAVYLIVTPSVGAALLAFSYLEFRAHRDG